MNHLKAFIGGLSVPAAFAPVCLSLAYAFGLRPFAEPSLAFSILWAPVIWGLWNVLAFKTCGCCPLRGRKSRWLAVGAALGLLLALIGVFVIRIPVILFGFSGWMEYPPLIVVPLIYAILWRYIVHPLNVVLGVEDSPRV
ncbi:MAG: hypothetical protein HY360_06845 [Verrucomicrobia bacterium]|nr:hypothetical protein [Verrucomicrobiota bacterium]